MSQQPPILTPLFPQNQMHDFVVGMPTNEERVWIAPGEYGTCLVPGDYSGADPERQFPEGFHTLAGGGSTHTGGFHQGVPFSPEKVRVMPFTPPNGKGRRAIRLQGKQFEDDESGVGVCSRFIEPNFLWTPGAIFSYRLKVVFPVTEQDIYFNVELRGEPEFLGRNEKTELVGVHFMGTHLMMKWWKAGMSKTRTANANEQTILKKEHTLLRDTVYTVSILLTCLPQEYQWQAHINVNAHGKDVWDVVTDETNSPGSHSSIGMDVFGIERGRVLSGTAFVLLAAPSVFIPTTAGMAK